MTLISRVEWFDHNTESKENAHLREIIGIGYWISKDVELVLDYQGVQYDKGVFNTDLSIFYTHLHFVF